MIVCSATGSIQGLATIFCGWFVWFPVQQHGGVTFWVVKSIGVRCSTFISAINEHHIQRVMWTSREFISKIWVLQFLIHLPFLLLSRNKN